jgi:hypothetical protein
LCERKGHIAGFCWGQLPYLWLSRVREHIQ